MKRIGRCGYQTYDHPGSLDLEFILATYISFHSSGHGVGVEGVDKVGMVITLPDFLLLVAADVADLH